MSKQPSELEVGDPVIIGYSYHSDPDKVARLTATQIVLERTKQRFNRRTVWACGGSHTRVRFATSDDINRIKRERLISKLCGLRRSEVEHLMLHQLETIIEILSKK